MSGSSSPVFFDVVDWREKLQNLMERQKEVEAREKQFEKWRREREDWRDVMRLETQVRELQRKVAAWDRAEEEESRRRKMVKLERERRANMEKEEFG
jgi:hypothetical protein